MVKQYPIFVKALTLNWYCQCKKWAFLKCEVNQFGTPLQGDKSVHFIPNLLKPQKIGGQVWFGGGTRCVTWQLIFRRVVRNTRELDGSGFTSMYLQTLKEVSQFVDTLRPIKMVAIFSFNFGNEKLSILIKFPYGFSSESLRYVTNVRTQRTS